MRVLVLSPYPGQISSAIRASGDEFVLTTDKIEVLPPDISFIVSFGYRHILKAAVFSPLGNRAMNLHTSFLPWNRGAHPNFWSWFDGTPKGVTLHVIDKGIDTGPIIAQEMVPLDPHRTLKQTYLDLLTAAEGLFVRNWPFLREGRFEVFRQVGLGSSHRMADIPPVQWDSISRDAPYAIRGLQKRFHDLSGQSSSSRD